MNTEKRVYIKLIVLYSYQRRVTHKQSNQVIGAVNFPHLRKKMYL